MAISAYYGASSPRRRRGFVVPTVYSPATGYPQADSPQGAVFSPSIFEDQSMNGYGNIGNTFYSNTDDTIQRVLVIGGGLSLLAGFFGKGAKMRKQAKTAGIAMVAAAFVRNRMAQQDDETAQAAGFGSYGEMMDGYGQSIIADMPLGKTLAKRREIQARRAAGGKGGGFAGRRLVSLRKKLAECRAKVAELEGGSTAGFGAMHVNPMHYAAYGRPGGVAAFGAYGVRDFDIESV